MKANERDTREKEIKKRFREIYRESKPAEVALRRRPNPEMV